MKSNSRDRKRSIGENSISCKWIVSGCPSFREKSVSVRDARPHPVYVSRACVRVCFAYSRRDKGTDKGREARYQPRRGQQVAWRDAAEESSSRTSLFRNRMQAARTVYVYYREASSWIRSALQLAVQEMNSQRTFLLERLRGRLFSSSSRFASFTSAGN